MKRLFLGGEDVTYDNINRHLEEKHGRLVNRIRQVIEGRPKKELLCIDVINLLTRSSYSLSQLQINCLDDGTTYLHWTLEKNNSSGQPFHFLCAPAAKPCKTVSSLLFPTLPTCLWFT